MGNVFSFANSLFEIRLTLFQDKIIQILTLLSIIQNAGYNIYKMFHTI